MQIISPRTRSLAILFIVTGLIGFLFSFLISVEKLALLQDASYIPPCSIDPFISCGSIMKTPQASLFGFPNSFIGLAGFSIISTIGFALLAGATFARWFWRMTGVGVTLALIFIFWLYYQSVYVIGALCPYCMVVWAVTVPLFAGTLIYLQKNGLLISQPAQSNSTEVSSKRSFPWATIITFAIYLFILLSILIVYWDYWMRFFG